MFLAFKLGDIVRVPFGYLLSWLYQLTTNYGIALILFAILVKLILYPTTVKSKKSTMKMSRLTPRLQAIQKKYEGDQQKLNEATQALYKEEGVSMGGGCLWSLLPLLIMIPLYNVVRFPITYILRDANASEIVKIIGEKVSLTAGYEQVMALSKVQDFKAALEGVASAATLNFDSTFLGIDLAAIPNFKAFGTAAGWTWMNIGAVVIPLLSSGSQILSMWISRKLNDSLVTDEKGVQDQETAKNSKANQSNKTMMIVMPLFSLWIGLTVPVALSLYWFIQGIVSTVVDVYLTKKYRTIYDAEDAERLKKAMELEAIEAEKERVRAERRAANPEGITQNTSKKKLQQKQQREAEAAKAAAKKEYDAKKGIVTEEEVEEKTALSGIAERPYCKGRAYDPNRYTSENTEE